MRDKRRVVALLYEGFGTFEFGIVAEVFGVRRPRISNTWYAFSTCVLGASPVRAAGDIQVLATRGLGALRRAGTIIIPGWRGPEHDPPPRLLRALRRAADDGARIIAICSGAFILASAGLLDGRRATTHWRYAPILASRFPRVRVESNVLYVDEGSVLTSAGSAAGIDLCLHVVRCDYGAEVANALASQLVMAPHREGGQAQYVREPLSTRSETGLASVLDWALARLHEPLSVRTFARRANMSPRTFARRFVLEIGSTPHRWVVYQRLLAARRALEMTDASIDAVAVKTGFATAMSLRHHFRRAYGTTPTAYRRRFSLRS